MAPAFPRHSSAARLILAVLAILAVTCALFLSVLLLLRPYLSASFLLRHFFSIYLLIGMPLVLVAGGLIAWFIKRQLDPLGEAADTLDAMTAGRRPLAPLPVDRSDEVGRLLTSFNRLLASIQTSEEKFRGLAETSIDLIFRVSTDGLVSYCSPAAREIMGREPERMVGTDFRRHVAAEDAGKAMRAFTAALQGEKVRLWEITLRRADGSTFAGEVNIAPIREDGQITGVQGVVRDVTRRRQAAAALAHHFMFQKMVADISALFVKTAADELDRAIEQALALSGSFFQMDRAYVFLYSPDLGRMNNTHEWCAAGIFPQKERIQDVPLAAFPWITSRLTADQAVHVPEVAVMPPEAAEKAEFVAQEIKSLLLFPLHGPERQIGFMGYDSVRRHRAWSEEEIGLLKVVAEIISNALIRGEVETELRRKSAELARSNAELTDFAYIASHDLQEPLRKISAFGDRLQSKYEAVLDEKGRDYLARMQNAALRMEQLINDLLQYSRVTTKGRPMAPVVLKEVLRVVLDDLEQAREELGAEIEIGQLPVVTADRNQMHSLFQNLVGNALKYHRPGVVPRIRVESDQPTGGQVTIRVSDNGIGFEEKYLERIFRPFQRLHGRSEYPGSGIGLAICKKIVERHHGEISAQSTPGQGSVFSVTLPWRPSEPDKSEPDHQ